MPKNEPANSSKASINTTNNNKPSTNKTINNKTSTTKTSNNESQKDSAIAESVVLGAVNANPHNVSFYNLIKEDFKTHESDFFSQGFWAIFNHRFGNWRMDVKPKLLRFPFSLLYKTHRKLVQIFCGIQLDYTVKLGRRVKVEHFGGIIISAKAIGNDVIIRQNTTLGIKTISRLQDKPTIEDGVSIGVGAVIIGDVTIGHHSTVGPNTVIYQDIPPYSTAYPAKAAVKTREPKS